MQHPLPVPLQEAHRPAILKLRHRPTSVQDVPTCEPLARTDHEPKAHLCLPTSSFCLLFFTVYRNTQRIDLHTEARYELRPAILFFELSGESEVVLWGNSVLKCIWTYVRNGLSASKRDVDPNQPPVFFSSQAGIQRSFLDVQSLTGLYTDIRSGRIVYSKRDMCPDRPLYFFELSGESEVVLLGKFCSELYIDIREE